jgi:hypothetical protein
MSADLHVVPELREGDNPFKVVNQYRKARTIAEAVLDLGATGENIEEVNDLGVAFAAKIAGVEAPNGGTRGVVWGLVKELVKERTT